MSSQSSYHNQRLVMTRQFDAPRELVFSAWIETSKVQLWWGCDDAEAVESVIETRVGGQYLHKMMLKDAGEYRHHGIITQYDPPNLLEYRLHNRFHENPMMVRVEFTELESQTIVHLTQDNLPETYSEFVIAGWAEGFAKLNTFLINEQITRGVTRPIHSS